MIDGVKDSVKINGKQFCLVIRIILVLVCFDKLIKPKWCAKISCQMKSKEMFVEK